jgi:glycosyltransferase involved in cell wall biosynthesis
MKIAFIIPGAGDSFYQSISVISVPITFDEGLGLYLCEAYACGVPAVEPGKGSFPEIVGDAGIIYNPNTPEQLANALESLLVDKEAYNMAVSAALNKASTLFNDRVMAEKLHHIYQSIIKN